ncbi:MAG: SxtJ family membrane protein [Pseudohongiellaceae bacterium]
MEISSLSVKEYRKFGLTLAAIFILLFGLFFPWLLNAGLPLWPYVVAAVFLAWALIAPATLEVVYKPWMRFAYVLGFINTRLILGLIYLVIFTPVSLFFALFRIDLLDRKKDKTASTYWKKSAAVEPKNMENVY